VFPAVSRRYSLPLAASCEAPMNFRKPNPKSMAVD